MVPEQIERETVIAAPVERVWTLLTEAEHLGRWFGDTGAEIDLRPGGAFSLSWEQHGTVRGRVVDVEPNARFSYRWIVIGDREHGDPVEGNSTLVEFTLAPAGDATRLRVVESGFAALATTDEQRRSNYDDNVGGWRQVLDQLDAHVARVAV
jgi:uncharacterized protein YndB with AHSA1/START domain